MAAATTPIRVTLAEDSLLVREGIQELLERDPRIDLVGVCGDAPSLLGSIERDAPDVVITDIRMPPTMTSEGIEIANTLRSSHSDLGVLVLSQYADAAYVSSLFQHGSRGRGYLLKDGIGDPDQLVAAVATVASGGSVVDPRVVESLVSARVRDRSPLDELTTRELEVLELVAAGKSNMAIADELVITKRAVEHHISAIFTKLELGDESVVHRRVRAVLVYLSARPDATQAG
ncbi:MAG TPA: response regulator transcription factor [Gaiellaceae bacterium]|nr:response regulator transcription factor [Gaiellaceae bacterium]